MTTTHTDATPVAFATILSCHVARVEKEVARLNVRAKRLRAAPYHLRVSAPRIRIRVVENRDGSRRNVHEEVVDVILAGNPVCAAGWTFIAKIDFLRDGDSTHRAEVIVSKAPGHESLEIDRPDAQHCDHCNTRRARAVCYVVQNDAGARKVIGSSCLNDFTGMGRRNVEGLVALGFEASGIFTGADDEEGGWGGGSRSRGDDLDAYLTAVAGMIRCYGWMSRGRAREIGEDRATADMASAWYGAKMDDRKKYWPELGYSTTRTDRAVALRAIHWAAQIDARNDYQENIATIARAGFVLPKHVGLAASIVSAWLRHRDDLQATAGRPRANPDATCGTIGKREVFQVMVASARVMPGGDFGPTTRVSLVDVATGAEIVWWCSGNCPDELWAAANQPRAIGAPVPTFHVNATVKKYADYKGSKQTVVSRLSIHVPKVKKARKPKAKKDAGDDAPAAA